MKRHLKRNLASLALCLSLCSCAGLPKGLTPKPDIQPVKTSVERVSASVGKAREHLGKEREAEQRVSTSLGKVKTSLDSAGDSQAIRDAQAALKEAEQQRVVSAQYRDWADTELSNSWRYLDDAKGQISILSGQIDVSHANEQLAVAAVEKWKPIIDQVNSWWGLGAIGYGLSLLAKHLLILVLALGVIGILLFIFARPVITLVATWLTVVVSWFRRK